MHEKTEDPNQVIKNFCTSYHQHEVKNMLWEWLVTAISRTHSIYDDGKERSSLFLLYENIMLLVDAAYTVHQQTPAPNPTAPAKNKKPGTSQS